MEKKGTLASPATARASRVLPVPGGPTSSTPLGMRPPRRWNFCASRRNSMISLSSSLASSTPATSLKVIFFCCMESRRARILPKLMALFPPDCIWRIMNRTKAEQQSEGRERDQQAEPEVRVLILDGDVDAVLAQGLVQVGIVAPGWWCGTDSCLSLIVAGDLGAVDGDVGDLALVGVVQQLRG